MMSKEKKGNTQQRERETNLDVEQLGHEPENGPESGNSQELKVNGKPHAVQGT
jgi:hypothetical protein